MQPPPRLKSPREVFERVITAPLDFLLGRLEPEQAPDPAPPPATTTLSPPRVEGPGCGAAERTLTVMAHLLGVASDWGGAGVLRFDVDNLAFAARGARIMGDVELAEDLLLWKDRITQIRSPEQATKALPEFMGVAERAWQLGVECGQNQEAVRKALAALDGINQGKIKVKGAG